MLQRKPMNKELLNERIEWLNYWIEDADKDKTRILLIGDSVARQFRKELNEALEEKDIVVDLIATSASVLTDRIESEILSFLDLNDRKYEAVIFNIGAHHGYWIDCENDEKIRKRYKVALNNLFSKIEEIIPIIIAVGGTPEKEEGIERKLENKEIRRRNSILESVALKRGYSYIDLYGYTIKNKFKYSDWVHFFGDAYEHFAQEIVKYLGELDIIESNRVYNAEEFIDEIREHSKQKIYIYGAGVKGRILREFLIKCGIQIEGFIVTDEYFENNYLENTKKISEINEKNILIIVSIEERTIWKEICNKEIEFITMSKDIYIKLKTYFEISALIKK